MNKFVDVCCMMFVVCCVLVFAEIRFCFCLLVLLVDVCCLLVIVVRCCLWVLLVNVY